MPSSIIRRIALDMLVATAALSPNDYEPSQMTRYLSDFKLRWKRAMSLLRYANMDDVNDTEDDYDDDDDYETDGEAESEDESDGETLGEEDTDDDDYETETEDEDEDEDDDYETEEEDEGEEDEDEYDDLPELVNDAESVCSKDYSDDESVCGQF